MRLRNPLSSGDQRSIATRKNVLVSVLIKGAGLIISYIRVPIVLNYLDVERYGLWLTISSIVLWVNYFDFGIGHGLRNNLAISLSDDDKQESTTLISSAYYYLTLIFGVFAIICTPVIMSLDWQSILNTITVNQNELYWSILIVFWLFIIRFIGNLITSILRADQKPALADALLLIGSLFSLLFVLAIGLFSENSLIWGCIAIAVPPTLVIAGANLIFFLNKYESIKPKYSKVNRESFTSVFALGMRFFVIQICALIMFSTSNVILSTTVDNEEVTIYNIARQYYSLPVMFFNIILVPYWSAITQAYHKSELVWIRKTMRRLLLLGAGFALTLPVLYMIEKFVLGIWIQNKVTIPLTLALALITVNAMTLGFSSFTNFINGVGKLRLSTVVVVFKTIIFLPLAIYLSKLWGATGLVSALILVNSVPSSILEAIQYKLIITKKDYGIWSR